MARRAARLVALAAVCLPLAGLGAVPPRPAPPIYATANYNLTFRSPAGTTYCPLPSDWIGSDHGTILFLEPPRDCGGAGYPSISRGYAPSDVARIEAYYGYAVDEGPLVLRRCRKAGTLTFLGRARTLCRRNEGGMISLEVVARYDAGATAEAIFTLRSNPARVARDLAAFRRLAASVRTCTGSLRDQQGAIHRWGAGPPCPRSAWF
jgi:hypothetical protein